MGSKKAAPVHCACPESPKIQSRFFRPFCLPIINSKWPGWQTRIDGEQGSGGAPHYYCDKDLCERWRWLNWAPQRSGLVARSAWTVQEVFLIINRTTTMWIQRRSKQEASWRRPTRVRPILEAALPVGRHRLAQPG